MADYDITIDEIREKVFPFLEREGLQVRPGNFKDISWQIHLQPKGLSSHGAGMDISLSPREDSLVYGWQPNSETNLKVFSRQHGILIQNRNGESLLKNVHNYFINEIQLDYQPRKFG